MQYTLSHKIRVKSLVTIATKRKDANTPNTHPNFTIHGRALSASPAAAWSPEEELLQHGGGGGGG
jgi:hypothetical protein